MDLRPLALVALQECDLERKLALVAALQAPAATLLIDPQAVLEEPAGLPGRPARPALIEPAHVPQRSVHTPAGRAALIHAICHIEFNAINLALDAIWRFAGLPEAYYRASSAKSTRSIGLMSSQPSRFFQVETVPSGVCSNSAMARSG